MIPYLFIFSIPIIASFFPQISSKKVFAPGWFSYLFLLFVFLALRKNIGGDWTNYAFILDNRIDDFNPFTFSYRSEYLFEFTLWIIKSLNLNIYYFFSFASFLFILALSIISIRQPNPWLGLVISFPLLINLLSIGYTRQSIAFSFLIFSLVFLFKNKNTIFFLFILIGSLYHKSLIIFLILPFFTIKSINRKIIFLLIALITLLIFYLIMKEEISRLLFLFLGQGIYFESKGALLRSLFHTFICILFLLFSNKLELQKNELIIWRFFALISIFLFLFVFKYSTFVDRMIFYFYPLHIVFFTRLYSISKIDLKFISIFGVTLIYILLYAFWVLNAEYFNSWFPYNNLLFL